MKPALFIIAPKDFRDEELFVTQAELEKNGIPTAIASLHSGECIGSKGGKAIATIDLDDINPNDYSTCIFIGGIGSSIFFENPTALSVAQKTVAAQKTIAAICVAPVILAKAGILKQKKATVFSSEIDTIEELGAYYTGMDVTVDGNIITAYGPQSALRFAKRIAEQLVASNIITS